MSAGPLTLISVKSLERVIDGSEGVKMAVIGQIRLALERSRTVHIFTG